MKIYRLRKQEFELFEWLDPYGLLERLILPNRFALVATQDDEEGKGDSPAGLMVGGIDDKSVFCEWICVDPLYRGWGVAENLISELAQIATHNKRKRVEIRFILSPDMKEVVSSAKGYFTKLGFEAQKDLPGEWEIGMKTLLSCDYFKQDISKVPKSVPLSKIEDKRVLDGIMSLTKEDKASSLYDTKNSPVKYDKNISCVCVSGGKPGGLLLSQMVGDCVYPVFMYAESTQNEAGLLLSAANEMKRQISPAGVIKLIASDEKIADNTRKLFPKQEITVELMSREV